MEGGVKRDFRDGENIFRRWATPICRRGRQTLEQTHIRICICKGMARRLPARRFAVWVSVFIGGGILASGADLLLPLEPFWQRASSWGLCTMTKGMGRGKRKGRGKKKGKGRTRHVEERSNAVRRTETNSRLEARGGGTPWRGYTGCPVNFTP